jgi:phosphoglycerate dehydrogenase-like enzyme
VSGSRILTVNLRDRRPVWSIPPWAVREVADALPAGWTLREVEAPADGRGDGGPVPREAVEAARGAEIYLGYGISREVVEAAGSTLRWVHSGAAGVGGGLGALPSDGNLLFTNSAGVHAEPIAETVTGMVLHFARGLHLAVRAQAERRWAADDFQQMPPAAWELAGATVAVVGLGGIGSAVARRMTALGARVVGVRRRGSAGPPGVEVLTGAGALDEALEQARVVVLTVPETQETRGMLGADRLGRLPEGAVLVNVSRGRVVDEEALVRALRSGRLGGAALDVFATEPLPPSSPLWSLPNVLITPHVSGVSEGFWRRETDLVLENLRRYLAGEPLLNRVDPVAGY